MKLKGRLTSGEAVNQFETAFQQALAGGHIFLVLDLEALPYIDSSGIGSVVNALRQANKLGGSVKLVNPAAVRRQDVQDGRDSLSFRSIRFRIGRTCSLRRLSRSF